jgi:glycosyltransferase involved in cell wall biosynthesis
LTNPSESIRKILVLSSWYPNRTAPFLGNFVQQQAYLLSEKFQVTVLYVSADEGIAVQEIIENNTENLKEIIVYYPKKFSTLGRKRTLDKAFTSGLKLVEQPDLIHGHCILPKGHLFSKAKAHFKCPLIVTEHGSYFRMEIWGKWSFKERLIATIAKRSIDKMIAVSEFQKKDLLSYFKGIHMEVIPNPIDTNIFKPVGIPEDKPLRFLHVSTLDPELKNPKGIIEAVDLLCAKGYQDFNLTIISDEPYNALQEEVQRLKLDSYVSFAGPIAHDKLVPFYNQSHALVMFSSYETFSIVIAEAWSCGIPVISTSVGIAADMDSHLGLVVQGMDPLSLALEMEKMIEGKEFQRQRIREHALQFSKKFVLDQLINTYNSLG